MTTDSITLPPVAANRPSPEAGERTCDPDEARLDRIFGSARPRPVCPYCHQPRRICLQTGYYRCGCDHTWLCDVSGTDAYLAQLEERASLMRETV